MSTWCFFQKIFATKSQCCRKTTISRYFRPNFFGKTPKFLRQFVSTMYPYHFEKVSCIPFMDLHVQSLQQSSMQNLCRVAMNYGPTFQRFWATVHEILGHYMTHFVVCKAITGLSILCMKTKIFTVKAAITLQSHGKTFKIGMVTRSLPNTWQVLVEFHSVISEGSRQLNNHGET